jgi:hypothetical protein
VMGYTAVWPYGYMYGEAKHARAFCSVKCV